MKINKIAVVAASLGVLLASGLGATSAQASTDTGSSTPSAAPSDLQALVGKQSASSIAEIRSSGAPAELIYDVATRTFIAAKELPTMSTQALTPVGPGCSTTSACMYVNGTTPNGYTGTGTLSGNWPNVNHVLSGNRVTHFFYSNDQYDLILAVNQSIYPTTPINVSKLARTT